MKQHNKELLIIITLMAVVIILTYIIMHIPTHPAIQIGLVLVVWYKFLDYASFQN